MGQVGDSADLPEGKGLKAERIAVRLSSPIPWHGEDNLGPQPAAVRSIGEEADLFGPSRSCLVHEEEVSITGSWTEVLLSP
jgi:hypothetical protein